MTTPVPDPWQTAMDPPKPSSEWYGQMRVNVWFCAPVKGVGKVPWDPNSLDPNTGNPARRYTAIDLALAPLSNQAMEDITRGMLAEFAEWPDIVLPSLKDLGVFNLQNLNGAWVRCEMVPTGRTYTNQNGETKEATTFRFLQLFPDEKACREAWKSGSPAPAAQAQQPALANGNNRRETAVKFLKPYVQNALKQAGNDVDKAREILAPMLANQKLLAEFFTVDSPEVLDLMTEAMPF